MKEIFILLRYMSLSKRRRRSDQKINLSWLGFIIPVIAFGLPIGLIVYAPLKSLPIQSSSIFFSVFIISTSFLFVLSYTPTTVFNLYGSSDVYFLLTLPIKRSSIFLFKAIDSLLYSVPALGFILPLCIAYSVAIGKGWFFGFITSVLFILFLIEISILFGALVSRVMSRTSAKILSNLIYLLTALLYVVILNIIRPDTSFIEGVKDLTYTSRIPIGKTLSYISPIGWVISLIRGEIIGGFLLLGALLFFGLLIYKVTDTLVIESYSSRSSKKTRFPKGSSGSPFLSKDIRLLYRDPQSIYMLLCSIIFPLMILIGNKNYIGASLVMATIASFYCSYITIHLLVIEKKVWPLPRLFPVKLKSVFIWKVLIPSSIYSLIYLGVTVISMCLFKLNRIILITVPMISIAFFYSGILATRLFLKDPTRDVTSRNIFKISEVFIIEITTIGIVAGIIGPFTIYLNPLIKEWTYKNVIGIGIPAIVSAIILWLSIWMSKGIIEAIALWE